MTIKAKSYSIGATETPFAEPGTRFYLLAASTPVNIKLYRDTQIVGEADGFVGGLELGPFCEPFTRWSATPQNGVAASVLAGVGDDPMGYNPIAGTLVFSDALAGADATPVGASQTPQVIATRAASNYRASGVIATATASENSFINAGNDGIQTNGPFTFTKIWITNNGAASQTFQIGVGTGLFHGGTSYTGSNCVSGGAASKCNIQSGAVNAAIWGTVLLQRTVAAGAQVEIDLSNNPIQIAAANNNSLIIYCPAQDVGFTCDLEWSE